MRLKSWMTEQLSQPGLPGGGQLAGCSSPSVQAHGVKAGKEEMEEGEQEQEHHQEEVEDEGETLGVQGGW